MKYEPRTPPGLLNIKSLRRPRSWRKFSSAKSQKKRSIRPEDGELAAESSVEDIKMGVRLATYAALVLLILVGIGPAAAEECCKADSSMKCYCGDTETLEACTPQLCADVKFQNQGTLFVPPSSDLSSQLVKVIASLFEHPRSKPQRNLAPTVRRERAPAQLFADLTLCFLPPPASVMIPIRS
jgi:hypothetical protein